jgi:hypothetical protein
MKGFWLFTLVSLFFIFLKNEPVTFAHSESSPIHWPQLSTNGKWESIPLSPMEAQFSKEMPGGLAKFTDGETIYILRFVTQITRKLHPIADCFKSSGFKIQSEPKVIFKDGKYFSFFKTISDKENLMVMESIWDTNGKSWSDVSAWYWGNLFDTNGPWYSCAIVSKAKQE